jgi:hypothetical protein
MSHMKPLFRALAGNERYSTFPYLGAILNRNMSATTCEAWAAKRGGGIAPSTHTNERATILAILNYAKREGLLLNNPALVLRRWKLRKSSIVIPWKGESETLAPRSPRMKAKHVRLTDPSAFLPSRVKT